MSHAVERTMHGHIARVLIVSLAVRLIQLNTGLTPWLLVPLTVLAALWTAGLLTGEWRMAIDEQSEADTARLLRTGRTR